MITKFHLRFFLMILLWAGLSGCAGLLPRLEPPQVHVAGVKLLDAGLLEQRYLLQLRVQNPNPRDVAIDGLQFKLELNGRAFATGVTGAKVVVPRFGSALVDVEAVSTLAGLARQLEEMFRKTGEPVRYGLTGKVHLAQPALALPFAQTGEFKWPGGANP